MVVGRRRGVVLGTPRVHGWPGMTPYDGKHDDEQETRQPAQ